MLGMRPVEAPGNQRVSQKTPRRLSKAERDIVFLHGRMIFADQNVSVPEIVGLCRFLADKHAIDDTIEMMEILESARSNQIDDHPCCERLALQLEPSERFQLYLELATLGLSDGISSIEIELLRRFSASLKIPAIAQEGMEEFFKDASAAERSDTRTDYLPFMEFMKGQEKLFGWRLGELVWLMPTGLASMTIAGCKAISYRLYGPFRDSDIPLEDAKVEYLEKCAEHEVDTLEVSYLTVADQHGGTIVAGIDFKVESGKLNAIMGPAGSGKSTILKAILGITRHVEGTIRFNGKELPRGLSDLGKELGYVPQDDLLFGELTVCENLRYRVRLSEVGHGITPAELDKRIETVLKEVGLSHRKNSLVGSEQKRSLSGGERRRLNIALELINSPRVILLDEPTSGLSSQDATDVVALLKQIAISGTLVLFVIHQPSSSIYELFDTVLILGKDGTLAFSGDPIAALELFQEAERNNHDGKDIVRCPCCLNLQPDILMHSLKAESADFWRLISKASSMVNGEPKRVAKESFTPAVHEQKIDSGKGCQFRFQFERTFITRLRDPALVLITLFGSPLLGVVCAFAFQYRGNGVSVYDFAKNQRYPQFLFMTVIASIFLGLTASCSEITKDRAIIMREKLSGIRILPGYMARLLVLTLFMIIQSLLFMAPAQAVLQMPFLLLEHAGMMTLTGFAAVCTGLLISSYSRSRAAAQNLIPVICLIQILLGGGFMKFSEMGSAIWMGETDKGKSPPVAQIMISRWAYEMFATADAAFQPYSKTFTKEKTEWNRISTLPGLSSEEKFDAKNRASLGFDRERAVLKASYNNPIPDQDSIATGRFLSAESRLSLIPDITIQTWLRDLLVLSVYSIMVLLAGVAGLQKKRY